MKKGTRVLFPSGGEMKVGFVDGVVESRNYVWVLVNSEGGQHKVSPADVELSIPGANCQCEGSPGCQCGDGRWWDPCEDKT